MPLLVAAVLTVVALLALIPLSLVLRYRTGMSRRRARSWIIGLNVASMAASVAVFLAVAAITNVWAPRALAYAIAGLVVGSALGALGLRLTRWERAPASLYYTPNRWLVLVITLVVTARLIYGFWRGWQAWHSGAEGTPWFAAAGVAGSMAAGATVLGYYLFYWWGVRRRLRSHGVPSGVAG